MSKKSKVQIAREIRLTPEKREFWEYVLSGKAKSGECRGFQSAEYCNQECPMAKNEGVCTFSWMDREHLEAMTAKAKEILDANQKFDDEPENIKDTDHTEDALEWEEVLSSKAVKINTPVVVIAVGRYEELLKIEKLISRTRIEG